MALLDGRPLVKRPRIFDAAGQVIGEVIGEVIVLHLFNVSLRYGKAKGVQVSRLEEPPLGSLAAPCHMEESASHPLPLIEGVPQVDTTLII